MFQLSWTLLEENTNKSQKNKLNLSYFAVVQRASKHTRHLLNVVVYEIVKPREFNVFQTGIYVTN